jgi:DNA-binding MarR family transcriptional regulator
MEAIAPPLADEDFRRLLAFRVALRRFHRWSEERASGAGLTHAQHQLLLAVRGHEDSRGPTIGDLADYLLVRHHSAVELVDRVESGGFVERRRDTSDSRVVRVTLTRRGHEAIAALTALHIEELRRLAPLLDALADS